MDEITFKDGSSATVGTAARSFEADRDLVTAIENKWTVSSTMTTISKYAYRNDEIGRRTDVVNTGSAFSASRLSKFDYDDRNELTESHRYNGTDPDSPGTAVTAQFFDYTFDPIGNRATYSGDSIEGAASYVTNAVNEYTSAVTPNETLTYDADGNLLTDATRTYTWDAENRLASVVPTSPTTGSKKVEFEYDWMGRRTRKKIYNYTTLGGTPWTLATDRRFVYDGWNLLAEYNYASSTATLKTKFTWGLDLSGQNGNNLGGTGGGTGVSPVFGTLPGLHGAGGIGGLLAMVDVANERQMAYVYNANGDVGQLVDSDTGAGTFGNTLAKYEYYPYGGIFFSLGGFGYTPPNPFKFSTKYRDDESALYYYGYRYHMPRLGRWIGADPAEEAGGWNLYAMSENCPIVLIDPHGGQAINPSGVTTQPTTQTGNVSTDFDYPDPDRSQGNRSVATISMSLVGKDLCLCSKAGEITLVVSIYVHAGGGAPWGNFNHVANDLGGVEVDGRPVPFPSLGKNDPENARAQIETTLSMSICPSGHQHGRGVIHIIDKTRQRRGLTGLSQIYEYSYDYECSRLVGWGHVIGCATKEPFRYEVTRTASNTTNPNL